jgi:AcrR family transcriptional regulator
MKASRTSWIQELKNPRKAEEGAQFCDEWYLLTDPGTVRDGELPPNWGLYTSTGDQLKLVKRATKLSPQEPGREFFFSLFRSLVSQSGQNAEEALLKAHYDNGYAAGRAQARQDFKDLIQDLRTPQPPNGLERLRSLLLNGPHESRAERIRVVEQFVERFLHWKFLHSTTRALDTIEFIVEGGLCGMTGKISAFKEELKQLLLEVEEREKAVAQITDEIKPSVPEATALES